MFITFEYWCDKTGFEDLELYQEECRSDDVAITNPEEWLNNKYEECISEYEDNAYHEWRDNQL